MNQPNGELSLTVVVRRLPLYWISFADYNKPHGQQFLGIACVYAYDGAAALDYAHAHKINPGGEAQFVRLPDSMAVLVKEEERNRLLSPDESRALVARIDEKFPKPVWDQEYKMFGPTAFYLFFGVVLAMFGVRL